MPDKARLLYFYLVLEADDDGFVDNTRMVMRNCGANAKSLEALKNNGFILQFESGAVLVTHWPQQNKVPKDRYVPTQMQRELSKVKVNCMGAYEIIRENF